jgi:hypothetical protein
LGEVTAVAGAVVGARDLDSRDAAAALRVEAQPAEVELAMAFPAKA